MGGLGHSTLHKDRLKGLGIVGATGLIGQALLGLIQEAGGQPSRCFASKVSEGKHCKLGYRLEALKPGCFEGLRTVLFCTPAGVSQKWVPEALNAGCRVIDGSSAFRLDPQAALIIPEVNAQDLRKGQQLIASPNCVTTLALFALEPLRALWGLEELSVCSYQAASGGGQALLDQLRTEVKVPHLAPADPKRLLFNLWPQIGAIGADGYTQEETKLRLESRKILNQPSLAVSATCVRVPTLQTHALAIEAQFAQPCDVKAAQRALEASALHVFPNQAPTLLEYANQPFCAVGRLRSHPDRPSRLSLFVLGDQILKGGALNMFQLIFV